MCIAIILLELLQEPTHTTHTYISIMNGSLLKSKSSYYKYNYTARGQLLDSSGLIIATWITVDPITYFSYNVGTNIHYIHFNCLVPELQYTDKLVFVYILVKLPVLGTDLYQTPAAQLS